MEDQMEITTRQEQPTASIRVRTPQAKLKEELGKAFGEVAMLLGKQGSGPAGYPFSMYYNMDMNDLDVEIGFPVAGPVRAEGRMKPSVLPGGRTAMATHKGPYEKFESTYGALAAFMQKSKVQPVGMCYEIYLNDPATAKPDDLLTEIYFPLKA
jgi:effector-binding domain-containing protein